METLAPFSAAQFQDRTLACADCASPFIFTAGEQLFFSEKQFKNDPKRCKPCKSRRSGLAAVANGTSPTPVGIARTETRTQCSDCGIETTVPFKPTQGRPVLCRQCFQLKSRALATAQAQLAEAQSQLAAAVTEPSLTELETVVALTENSTNSLGEILSPEAAILAATSMATAPDHSSIATSEDLASILTSNPEITPELLATAAQA